MIVALNVFLSFIITAFPQIEYSKADRSLIWLGAEKVKISCAWAFVDRVQLDFVPGSFRNLYRSPVRLVSSNVTPGWQGTRTPCRPGDIIWLYIAQ